MSFIARQKIYILVFCLLFSWPSKAFLERVQTFSSEKVSEFFFENEEGKKLSLKDFQGKVVVLTYWTTRCSFCLNEMPLLDKLSQHFPDVAVLLLCKGETSFKDIHKIYEMVGVKNLQAFKDSENSSQTIFALRGVPTTIIFDRSGKMVGRLEGFANWTSKDALALIQSYLDGKNPEKPSLWKKVWLSIKSFFQKA
jgi:thiol-disulfide isomerase/thioredoxin